MILYRVCRRAIDIIVILFFFYIGAGPGHGSHTSTPIILRALIEIPSAKNSYITDGDEDDRHADRWSENITFL